MQRFLVVCNEVRLGFILISSNSNSFIKAKILGLRLVRDVSPLPWYFNRALTECTKVLLENTQGIGRLPHLLDSVILYVLD